MAILRNTCQKVAQQELIDTTTARLPFLLNKPDKILD